MFSAILLFSTGCAPLAERLARDITPAVVEEGLETAAQPETARAIEEILSMPEVERAMMRLSETAVDSVVMQLTQEEQRELIAEITRDITSALLLELSAQGPTLIDELVTTAIQTGSRQLLTEIDRVEISDFVEDLTQTGINAALDQLQASLPQLMASIEDPSFQESFLPLVYSIALQATYATNDALLQLEEGPSETAWFPDMGFLRDLAVLGVLALGAIVVVLLIILARLVGVIRRQRREIETRS